MIQMKEIGSAPRNTPDMKIPDDWRTLAQQYRSLPAARRRRLAALLEAEFRRPFWATA